MSIFAGFKSVGLPKSRLQAALYYARKRNRQKRIDNPDTAVNSPDEEIAKTNPPPPPRG